MQRNTKEYLKELFNLGCNLLDKQKKKMNGLEYILNSLRLSRARARDV